VYNLNYTLTTFRVKNSREITSCGTQTKKRPTTTGLEAPRAVKAAQTLSSVAANASDFIVRKLDSSYSLLPCKQQTDKR
jgi:hypothetical protein